MHRHAGEKGHPESCRLAAFIERMGEMVSTYREEARQVAETERLLSELIADPSWMRREWMVPCDEKYARYVVHRDPQDRFDVIALVWKPGQATLLHDHDGTWGVEGVVKGTITITNFLRERELGEDLVQLRELETVEVGARGTGQLLPPADCHIVANRGTETAITVHVYGKPLRQFRIFEETSLPGVYRGEWIRVHTTSASVA